MCQPKINGTAIVIASSMMAITGLSGIIFQGGYVVVGTKDAIENTTTDDYPTKLQKLMRAKLGLGVQKDLSDVNQHRERAGLVIAFLTAASSIM